MDRPLVVLDTETATAMGAPHLLELGALRVVEGEVVDQFESLVRPQVPIEEEVHAVHGIADEDVRGAPAAHEVLAAFAAWAGDDWLVAHNARFDAKVLGYEYVRAGLAPPPGPFVDTLALAREHIPEAPDHKLRTLVQHLGLEDGPHHRALADAVYCWQVLEACLVRLGEPAGATALLAGRGGPITIRSEGPRPPRIPRRLRAVEAAAAAAEVVTALYGEPLAPPATVRFVPRFLFEHRSKGYVEAEDARSGELKTYRLDRIQRVLRAN